MAVDAIQAKHVPKGQVRGRAAIREIVKERPGLWSLGQLREALRARSQFSSGKAVEMAVSRMRAAGECRRTSSAGVYLFGGEEF